MTSFRTPYAGYDVLAKWDSPSWDDRTRDVLRRRLTDIPGRRFFTADEWQTLEAICSRIIPQPDRAEPVPIVPWIDDKLHRNQGDGFRYEDMPPMRDAWRLGLEAVDEESRARFGGAFLDVLEAEQDAVLRAIHAGDVRAANWSRLPPQRFFSMVLLKEIVGEYYAHPAAWSEVGFGGPASPRGYVRLGDNQRDPWEAAKSDEA